MVVINVDNRLRLPASLPGEALDRLKGECTHANPAYHKARSMGFRYTKEPALYETWKLVGGSITLPRGRKQELSKILLDADIHPVFCDNRIDGDPQMIELIESGSLGTSNVTLWDHQQRIVEAIIDIEQGLVRAPTGSGKTTAGIAAIHAAQVPAIVIVWNAGLAEQWIERLVAELGLAEDDIGLLGNGHSRWRPITIAMQQTLARSKEKLARACRTFGFVLCDECFEGSAPVMMRNGTTKPISMVEVGDEVVGGRVTAIMSHLHEGPMARLNGSLVTTNHPVATDLGWLPVSALCNSDVLVYLTSHEDVQNLREETTSGFCWGVPCEVPTKATSLSLEQGSNGRNQRSSRQECSSASWQEAGWRCTVGNSASCQNNHSERKLESEAREWTAYEVLEGRGAGAKQAANSEHDCGGKNCSVWERSVRLWWSTNSGRNHANEDAANCRVRVSTHSSNWSTATCSNSLQARLCSCSSAREYRGRWEQPSNCSAEGLGCTKGPLPAIEWLDGASLPGAGRLHLGHCSVQAAGIDRLNVFNLETESGVYVVGNVVVHNCQRFAADTFLNVVDAFPARYRVGLSADESRKDRKEVLIYDVFGRVIADVPRQELEHKALVMPVDVRVVPTDFDAPWYAEQIARNDNPNFNRLIDEMVRDDKRNELLDSVVQGSSSALVLTHRREHALQFQARCAGRGVDCGLMLGGAENKDEFARSVEAMRSRAMTIAVGSYQAIGQGLDIKVVELGVCATPIHSNRQFFGQVRGRICRKADGKQRAELVYLWDRLVFGSQPLHNLSRWNDRRVVVWDGTSWIDVDIYLERNR